MSTSVVKWSEGLSNRVYIINFFNESLFYCVLHTITLFIEFFLKCFFYARCSGYGWVVESIIVCSVDFHTF